MSIAYLDPGNIESDLQSGARAGFKVSQLDNAVVSPSAADHMDTVEMQPLLDGPIVKNRMILLPNYSINDAFSTLYCEIILQRQSVAK